MSVIGDRYQLRAEAQQSDGTWLTIEATEWFEDDTPWQAETKQRAHAITERLKAMGMAPQDLPPERDTLGEYTPQGPFLNGQPIRLYLECRPKEQAS